MPDPRNRLTWNATCKVYPAICDIQAPDDTIRVVESFGVLVPGLNERLLYQCPVGKCAVIQYAYANCVAADPTAIHFIVKVGVTVYNLSFELHVAGVEHFIKPNIFLKAGDYFGTSWSTCIIGNILKGTVLGYEMLQY